ncbi:glycerol-3-phosphate 1-O-acyltransferase PlsY [Candidatus Dependentiae bacterium]|nr:glycerol-3-phosphate 1-O-acyltransferase PlsY [Candidatus Dependentiae bacterium]
MIIQIIIIGSLSYLIGAIPFAYIMVKLIKKTDLRTVGSGNVGATNAMRVLGWKLGLVVFLLDFLKGFIAVGLVSGIFGSLTILDSSPNLIRIIAGICAICGHVWTVFLKFKGGKGVATSAGVFAFLIPIPFLLTLAVFILVVSISRFVSLGSISAAAAFPILTFVFKQDLDLKIFTIFLAVLVTLTHISNLKRLINGTEKRLSFKSSNTGEKKN